MKKELDPLAVIAIVLCMAAFLWVTGQIVYTVATAKEPKKMLVGGVIQIGDSIWGIE